MELITRSFQEQCLAFPDRVDAVLSTITTVEEAKDMLDKAAAMSAYAERLKAGIEIERPISLGVLKIKAKIGELMPAKSPGERGQGRGKKESSKEALPDLDFTKPTIAAYRKLAANQDRLQEYYESIDDVPTQTDFLRHVAGAHVDKNSGENEWYTPEPYIAAARQVMGGIDLDPASSADANMVVQSAAFFDEDANGLDKQWSGRVWMNPPYAQPLVSHFCNKLANDFAAGDVTQACVLVNNATETKWFQNLASHASSICFPSGRVKFWEPSGKPSAPLQGQAVLYLGDKAKAFKKSFSAFGVTL